MFTALIVLHVLVSVFIILVVLLQTGKGADIGSVFGSGGSQTVFGSMGGTTFLGKLTTAVAIMFMLTSFSLAVLSSKKGTTIMKDEKKAEQTLPAKPAPAQPQSPTQQK